MAGYRDVEKKAKEIGGTMFDAVVAICKEGQDVRIQGFGTFKKHHKEAYTGRNPKTSEEVAVPAKDILKFKVSKEVDMNPPKAARRR